jgi:predicted RNase H-like HicB family nuclease
MTRSVLEVAAMAGTMQLTAIIEREGGEYVSVCPELDIASQGTTIEKARDNLQEAIELFFETADPSEIAIRLHDEVFVTRLEVAVG